jgi:hypothetical protein
MSKVTTGRTQLPIDECKDWILHALELEEQYSTNIRYAVDGKWEFLVVINSLSLGDLFHDVTRLTKIEKVTGMVLIKTRKSCRGIGDDDDDELWFGRPIGQKKLQEWINDLINWTVYSSRYRNLN